MRWLTTFGTTAGVILVYRHWLHVNPTTVALTLVLLVLLLASSIGLRYAVAASLMATACFNYYFLPPLKTFTIADTQNWLALFTFLATGVIGSRLSQKARDEADHALAKQRELELLFALSRDLLQTDNVAELVNALPMLISVAAGAGSSTLYLLDGDRVYQSGVPKGASLDVAHMRQLALTMPLAEHAASGESWIALRAGVKPRGLLRLSDVQLSDDVLQAIGGLTSIALDRAQALEDAGRSEAAKESERLRTLILDSITHELRTPLTSIKGATGTLLTMDNVAPEDRRELLTIIDEEADRLNHLVGQAVEMALIETQEVHMDFLPVTFDSIMAASQENCGSVAGTHRLTIQSALKVPVLADRAMIAKVLCNLLENAAKYSTPGSPIVVSTERRDNMAVISVADRGAGIDASEQDLIFDKLYRSRTHSQQVPGTGMGLAISRAIVEAHHGTLTVTSQLQHGSVFSFSLRLSNT